MLGLCQQVIVDEDVLLMYLLALQMKKSNLIDYHNVASFQSMANEKYT
jgi:hypothetical protein